MKLVNLLRRPVSRPGRNTHPSHHLEEVPEAFIFSRPPLDSHTGGPIDSRHLPSDEGSTRGQIRNARYTLQTSQRLLTAGQELFSGSDGALPCLQAEHGIWIIIMGAANEVWTLKSVAGQSFPWRETRS
jgi:hypothetical protein